MSHIAGNNRDILPSPAGAASPRRKYGKYAHKTANSMKIEGLIDSGHETEPRFCLKRNVLVHKVVGRGKMTGCMISWQGQAAGFFGSGNFRSRPHPNSKRKKAKFPIDEWR